ncbi:Dps family protein [Streptomyces sp. NPDC002405]|uniref:Dps family protein n=1 Tax=Streptomyces sp. NPDC057596 TaxID=3346178 RepID=UPI0036C48D4A
MDLVEPHLQGKQAHWNVVGHNFRDLHLHLDQFVDDARGSADTIAERLRALAARPDGHSDTVGNEHRTPTFPEGELRVSAVVITCHHMPACHTVLTASAGLPGQHRRVRARPGTRCLHRWHSGGNRERPEPPPEPWTRRYPHNVIC